MVSGSIDSSFRPLVSPQWGDIRPLGQLSHTYVFDEGMVIFGDLV